MEQKTLLIYKNVVRDSVSVLLDSFQHHLHKCHAPLHITGSQVLVDTHFVTVQIVVLQFAMDSG